MAEERRQAELYELQGPGIAITYRRGPGELTITSGDFESFSGDTFAAEAAVQPEVGIVATAVLLPSSRNGTRIALTLVLPEVSLAAGADDAEDVTGAAIVTTILQNLVGGAPAVEQRYDVRPLEGSASAG